jgi:hypothetical protein
MDIQITGDALPWLRQIKAEVKDGSTGLRKVMAHAAANEVRENFRELDRERHRPHVQHHFYASAARATSSQVSGSKMQVVVDHVGIRLRYYGGTVTPRRCTYLTIPANVVAERYTAREFPEQLHFRKTRKGGLLETDDDRVMYWLVKSVTQKADPSVIPTDDKLNTAAIEAGKDYLERL